MDRIHFAVKKKVKVRRRFSSDFISLQFRELEPSNL